MVPLFIVLYFLFKYLDNNAHKLYLNRIYKATENKEEKSKNENSKYRNRSRNKKITKYVIILAISGILLFLVGELLGNTLESLCVRFNVPQVVIGILLGFITSIPELITFFESQKHHKKSENDILGIVEATNNLLTSNTINLFIIQTIGILLLIIFKN